VEWNIQKGLESSDLARYREISDNFPLCKGLNDIGFLICSIRFKRAVNPLRTDSKAQPFISRTSGALGFDFSTLDTNM
jgi:hypothetical protein